VAVSLLLGIRVDDCTQNIFRRLMGVWLMSAG